ncbi:MAG TPA: SDR family oxidoreductase, partial [Acidimicrobiales bacterium]|nr:SDR family oxidoreductase [Acidimicrobiales bacterium]
MDLEGAGALVTGGASGIGRAVVALLRARGARVAVLDVQDVHEPAEVVLRCDIADEAQVDAAVGAAHDALGRLDVAVLNAGVGGFGGLLELDAGEWDRVMGINLRGTFLCLRAAGRVMVG